MKNQFHLLLLTIILFSCGTDEITYPATFEYDRDENVGSSIITIGEDGLYKEVDAIHSLSDVFEGDLCDFLTSIVDTEPISSITLLSDSEVEIAFNVGNMNTNIVFPYSKFDDVISGDFGFFYLDDDEVISKVCYSYAFGPNAGAVASADYCVTDNAYDGAKSKFLSEAYALNDTLGLCLINKLYKFK